MTFTRAADSWRPTGSERVLPGKFGNDMSIRVALIGHGNVGSIHAGQLSEECGVELVTVFGVDREPAAQFASKYAIPHVSETLEEALSRAEVAIICSPSP